MAGTSTATLAQARAAKHAAAAAFERFGDIVGVGIALMGTGYGIKINFRAPPRTDEKIPETVDGVPVKVEVTGTITAR
jgi:hypothetical protein